MSQDDIILQPMVNKPRLRATLIDAKRIHERQETAFLQMVPD